MEKFWLDQVPGLKFILEDTYALDEMVDIILADSTFISVEHILNIIKHGSTAVFKEDMKDFIEAGKMFLNVDLGLGIIRSNGEGVEFEIEQGFTCKKYVGLSSKDKEIVCISTKDFDR